MTQIGRKYIGKIEQHTGYYPYGEPWSEPSGQPWLYGGKERMHDNGLNEYDFSARRLNSALCLWTTPDPLAQKFANTNPYTYCAANPIRFIDPTGKELVITGDDREAAIKQLQNVLKTITLIDDENTHKISYKSNNNLNRRDLFGDIIKEIIDNKDITLLIESRSSEDINKNAWFAGGAYMGNQINNETGHVTTFQYIMPSFLATMDEVVDLPGYNLMHEITESYEGGKIALETKMSSPPKDIENSTYNEAHIRAIRQSVIPIRTFYDENGDIIPEERWRDASRVEYIARGGILTQKQVLILNKKLK